jgi:uncharacterized protein YkwD
VIVAAPYQRRRCPEKHPAATDNAGRSAFTLQNGQTSSWNALNDRRLEQAYNRYRNKEMAMEDVNPVQISNQLGQIVAQLSAIREALEKLVAQSDHPAYNQTKRY